MSGAQRRVSWDCARKLTLRGGTRTCFCFARKRRSPLDPTSLIEVAREAQVSVHAICSSPEDNVRQVCRATGGFYAITESVPKTLSGFYQGNFPSLSGHPGARHDSPAGSGRGTNTRNSPAKARFDLGNKCIKRAEIF